MASKAFRRYNWPAPIIYSFLPVPTIDRKTYWRRQLRRTFILLAIWAIVGFGLSILLVEQLNHVRLGEMPLGFWMAQQGSIFVFIILILVYALLSERADREAGLDQPSTEV